MTPQLREMMNIMLDMVACDEGETCEAAHPEEGAPVDFLASPERQELYGKVCEFAKNQERINEEMLEQIFEIGYGLAALIIDRMKDEGRISQKRDEEYFYRTL